MVEHRKKYRPWDPEGSRDMTVSPGERLPDGDLVFFLLDVVPQLDLDVFYESYEVETRGAPPFEPAMLVCLLLYSYCVGVFSSRKIALACERNLAFLAIVGEDRPNFRVISDFRKEHLEAFAGVFSQVLRLASELGMVGLGNISFDGSKLKANASRHKAMSYGYLKKEDQRLKQEILDLLTHAQETDGKEDAALGTRRGDELPDELRRRQERLATIQAAKQRLEEQAQAAAEAERQHRAEEEEAQRQQAGKKRRGKEPKPVSDTPEDKAQTSFTDPEAKMMPQSNKGWEYSGNAQMSVDGMSQIIIACFVTMAVNDKEQAAEPLGQATMANLEQTGMPLPLDKEGKTKIPATLDNGYYSEKATKALQEQGFDPYIAAGRQKHNQGKQEAPTPPLPANATAKERMAAKVRTAQGKALYSRRKVIVEPVFGQIKGARGFRQFSLRGLQKVNGEWRLVCLTHNLLKVWRHGLKVK